MLYAILNFVNFYFVLGNLETSLIDNANVVELFSGFNKISNFLDRDLVRINQSILLHKNIISQLTYSIENIHQSLDYFVEGQTIKLPYKSTSVDVFIDQSNIWLVAGSSGDAHGLSCSNTSVFTKTSTGNIFWEHSKVRICLKFNLGAILVLYDTLPAWYL